MKYLIKPILFTVLCCIIQFAAFSEKNWPQEISLQSGGKITIYQPQPESLNGDKLTARAAVSIRRTGNDEPVFGTIWFDASLQTDKDSRIATIESITVTQTKFPGIEDAGEISNYTGIIENEVPNFDLQMSIDELLTSIDQEKQLNTDNLNNSAPNIIYKTQPSTLITIDGEPDVQMDDDLKLERVMNSPFLIIKNPDNNRFYLYGGGFWYSSGSITSGYIPVNNLPSILQPVDEKLKEEEQNAQKDQDPVNEPATPTQIIVSTVPAELIQTEGEATYKNIQGTSLLYADNTLDDIFKDINSQKTFILVSGRWYSSSSLNGPWVFVASDALPEDFARIPRGSEKDGVLASVAGTDEANEAVTDAQIPQTAKVDRNAATCTVTYDGNPKFSPIDNTNLSVAENSNITVIKSGNQFFAVDNGVWFISNQATGPWQVSTERPADVEKIPAENPAYNSKYVYIYDVTPDYIYTGYTSGYLGNYIYGPTVVWGTGWHYKPWYGRRYYPRPVTWGFGMRYNPWNGWNMGFEYGFNDGWFHYGMGRYSYRGGWFGPSSFRPPFRPWGWNGGYYNRGYNSGGYRFNTNLGRPNVTINRPVIIRNNININNYNHTNNIYRLRRDVETNDVIRRPGNTTINNNNNNNSNNNNNNRNPANKPLAKPVKQPNNIYAGNDGNVFKKDNNNNWQQRDNKNWKPAAQNQVQDLNRDNQSRDRGNNREANFNHATRPAPPPAPKPAPKTTQNKPGKPPR